MSENEKRIPLMRAALDLGMTYRTALDAVLRHDLDGHQDHARRWTVTVDSVRKLADELRRNREGADR